MRLLKFSSSTCTYDQHWSSSGLCSLPTALLPVHQLLHIQRPLCQAPEVCRRHHTDWPLRSITVWFISATKSDLRRLRRVVRTADRIIGTTLHTLHELYLSRVSKRASKITLGPSHSAHSLFELLPSGGRYRAPSTRTTKQRNSFFPHAIHLMSTWH